MLICRQDWKAFCLQSTPGPISIIQNPPNNSIIQQGGLGQLREDLVEGFSSPNFSDLEISGSKLSIIPTSPKPFGVPG